MYWSRRVAVVATVLVIAGAGWSARSYWPKLPLRSKTGTAVLESAPAGAQVLVDGTLVGNTPLQTELTAGHHFIEFRRRNGTPRKLEIDVAAGASTVGRVDWMARHVGRLHVNSVPTGAKVIIDSRAHGVTPQTIDDLTVGPHTVVLETANGSVRKTVDIVADHTAEISEAIYSGWLHVSSPIELEIADGKRGIYLDERNQVLLPPGSHELQFENRALGYRDTRAVDVRPGEITNISIVPPASPLTVTATLPAEVMVDGERVGETPLMEHPINLGTREITVRSATGAERRFTVTVTVNPVRLVVDFSAP